jgi:hypothetical protein
MERNSSSMEALLKSKECKQLLLEFEESSTIAVVADRLLHRWF